MRHTLDVCLPLKRDWARVAFAHLRISCPLLLGTGHRVTQGMAELISKVLTVWGSSSAL